MTLWILERVCRDALSAAVAGKAGHNILKSFLCMDHLATFANGIIALLAKLGNQRTSDPMRSSAPPISLLDTLHDLISFGSFSV
jgi:hypothetical protein